jgi:adenylate cyclase class 2
MTLEVELKFRLVDEPALRQTLTQLNVEWHAPIAQVDCYFNHPARDFAQTDEALRLRQVGSENVITYKGPKLDAATKTRREIELPIAPGEPGLRQFGELLIALSFRRVAEVRKQRTKATFTWQGWPVELAIDAVAGVGPFVELEIQSEESDLAAARQAIIELAQRLSLTQSERRSYLELLLAKMEAAANNNQ